MKCPICLFFTALCFSAALGLIKQEAYERLRSNQKYCVRLSGVRPEQVEKARLDEKISEDPYQEKFAVCMLKKFNVMNTDGSINRESSDYKLLTDNPMSILVAKGCVNLAGLYVRESARKIMNCLLQTDIMLMVREPQN